MRNLFLLSVCSGMFLLSGCAVTQATLKSDDGRTVARSINDINAARTIKARMTRAHGFKLKGVDVEVREGVALLSGRAPRPEDRIEAERIAWSAPRIDQVGNEVRIGDKQGLVRNAKDGFIEKSVRTRFIADKDVDAADLNIETHEGIVYILGMVDNVAERDEATRIASTTRGVKEVVSYIKVKGDPAPQSGMFASAPAPSMGTEATIPAPSYALPEEVVGNAPIVSQSPLANITNGGPLDVLPNDEPIYRDPETGEVISLPPGTQVVPYTPDAPGSLGAGGKAPPGNPTGAPFYIDPDNGQRIPVVFTTPQQ